MKSDTTFGLDGAEMAGLVRSVSSLSRRDPEDTFAALLTPDQIAERFARASWTGIAEPGDSMAGVLVAALGATQSLTAVTSSWSVSRIVSAATDCGTSVDPDDLIAALARWSPRLSSGVALVALRQAARCSVRLITPLDDCWPRGVDDLGVHAPIALWLRGKESTMARTEPSIALVGARAATGYGEHVAMEASAGLVDRGYTIISGAAYGIDGMAHRAALASSGQTIAFLAGGVDRYYPSGHEALLTRISEQGAVISELPCGSPPTKWRFLQRNRLIAAASQATIVLEAGWRSGSLNTAGHAAQLGRPLGAVPGPVTSAASAGCHRLIRDFDATLVTTAAQMAELNPFDASRLDVTLDAQTVPTGNAPESNSGHPDSASSAQTRLLDALSVRAPRAIDDLAARAGLSIAAVQSQLGSLALAGQVKEGDRGWTAVARSVR